LTDTIILAPMHGATDYIYRNIYHAHFSGIDLAISPFINALPDEKLKKSQVKGILPENNHGMSVIPQILGSNADDFIFLANYLHDLGYKDVNWNLGCPYRMIVKRKRGAGILPHPDLVAEFLDKVIPAIPLKLSVKLRLGLNDTEEIDAIVPILNQHSISEVTIHPRLGIQMYDGSVDLDAFERCMSAFTMPVVYNGDIVTVDGFMALKERFPNISRWMIGRGVIRNPWLPSLIKGRNIRAQISQLASRSVGSLKGRLGKR